MTNFLNLDQVLEDFFSFYNNKIINIGNFKVTTSMTVFDNMLFKVYFGY